VVVRLAARCPTLGLEYIRSIVRRERERLERGTRRDVDPATFEDAATEQLRKQADPVRVPRP
jgi:hypothetical protein